MVKKKLLSSWLINENGNAGGLECFCRHYGYNHSRIFYFGKSVWSALNGESSETNLEIKWRIAVIPRSKNHEKSQKIKNYGSIVSE